MLGKTHMAAGVAAAIAVTAPSKVPELMFSFAAAMVGSVISDIDADESKARREADIVLGIAALFILTIICVEMKYSLGLYRQLMKYTTGNRAISGAVLFLLICLLGRRRPHREFMHSLCAAVLTGACVWVIYPPATLPFVTAFISHILLDTLNRKKVHVFWPAGGGISFRLCSSQGVVNAALFLTGMLVLAVEFIYFCAHIG